MRAVASGADYSRDVEGGAKIGSIDRMQKSVQRLAN
jgi:hypothetical protein